ncbi:hypothetical protein CAPTEDRAFT_223654 [Capitella teleta]|uniref:VWFA domain-containing protein n=1 Tax=Capitella teleta TaxID=283909 RepID=R7T3K9_CAPTE|nr:hypothetical protein CAPTEDRAFT_223654 [Capitella teleta]|eukprot:ELT87367.1 hypothetical protein CAPTEDRAFT_223654 [Capitella teleta]
MSDSGKENDDQAQEEKVTLREDEIVKEETAEEGGEEEEEGEGVVLVQRMPKHGTMFGRLREKNVTFCVDTSGSMIKYLEAVKQHLIEFLQQKAIEDSQGSFNILEFSTRVTLWSDKMVQCTPQTVAVASDWIQRLVPQTGTNTMEALLSAFSDANCDAVCLITDGLPDQNPSDVLDNVVYTAQNRPVHCYYVQSGSPESKATEFLQSLAMDTYGSFHIITAADSGLIERISPIYRAEATAERVIRTTDNNIYPSNHKVCTVGTRLGEIARFQPGPYVVHEPLHPFCHYPWPFRFYYQFYNPLSQFSRYRTARSMLAHEKEFLDTMINVCPGAGVLVVGSKVLARRHDDGLFYVGKVNSQLLSNKFLVEFGPCKHGKYLDTSYQETFIHDIVSYEDALRHAVLAGDRVLAPWEPEGERYGPGVVVEGQERRGASGGTPDQKLVVTFFNGKTADIPLNRAMWIPNELYERIAFEVHLPSHVRRDFADQDEYPEETLEGYPASGTGAYPTRYETVDSHWLPNNNRPVIERGIYQNPYYVPMYPIYYKFKPQRSIVKSEEVAEIIPGTELTKAQLKEKVMAQITRHKVNEEVKETEETKLLSKREQLQDTAQLTKKSVTFTEGNTSDLEAEFDSGDLDMRDSGRGSGDDLYLSDVEGYESGNDDKSTQTRSAYSYTPRRSRSTSKRPPWKYWSRDPSPNLLEPMHYGPHRVGPYDEADVAPPMECRNILLNSQGVEWTSPVTKVVDPYSSYSHKCSVSDSMCIPCPPKHSPEKQKPGSDLSEVLGMPLPLKERLAISRQDFRRQRALQREADWSKGLEQRERMNRAMEDQHRSRVRDQMVYELKRHTDTAEARQRTREAKKLLSEEIRAHISENQQRESDIVQQRMVSRTTNRQRREEIVAQRQREIEETIARRQAIREQNASKQSAMLRSQLAEADAQSAAAMERHRKGVRNRIQHFRDLEDEGQRRKSYQQHATDAHHYTLKSQIFP